MTAQKCTCATPWQGVECWPNPMHGIDLKTGEHTIYQQEGPDITCPGCELCTGDKLDLPFIPSGAVDTFPKYGITEPIPPWLMPQGRQYHRSDDLDEYLEQERERNAR